jgi:Bacterial PH domain
VVGHEGITTRGVVRERRWTWRDIHDIRVEEFTDRPLGAPARSCVWVYNVEGRRFMLSHVNDLQVDVHAEVAAIRAVWLELLGAG